MRALTLLVLTLAACGRPSAPAGAAPEPTPAHRAGVAAPTCSRPAPAGWRSTRCTTARSASAIGDKVVVGRPVVEGRPHRAQGRPRADHRHPPRSFRRGRASPAVRKDDALVVAPPVVAEKFAGAVALANGEARDLGFVRVEAIPMYNLEARPRGGQAVPRQGPRQRLRARLGDRRIHLSGDTECTPEMKALRDIDVAFVCMNLPYTMTPAEAAECVDRLQAQGPLSLSPPRFEPRRARRRAWPAAASRSAAATGIDPTLLYSNMSCMEHMSERHPTRRRPRRSSASR